MNHFCRKKSLKCFIWGGCWLIYELSRFVMNSPNYNEIDFEYIKPRSGIEGMDRQLLKRILFLYTFTVSAIKGSLLLQIYRSKTDYCLAFKYPTYWELKSRDTFAMFARR